MKRTWKLCTLLGIPVKIHVSILLTFAMIAYVVFVEKLRLSEAVGFSAYVICLFACVLMHEYGHALMARRYGIGTQDIILTPIGGIARLRGLPTKPGQEIMVAIAGPLVNLVILLLIVLVFQVLGIGILQPDQVEYEIFTYGIGFMHMIFVMNLVLFAFNLIPAFPMDGGRILRALLAYKLSQERATFIALIVGRGFAIAFVVLGLYNKAWILALIGGFIFIAAGMEYGAIKRRAASEKKLA